MTVDNTIKFHDGSSTDVYENNIKYLADEYVSSLRDEDEIYKPNNNLFTGMIKYIHKNICFSRDILADINILNDIWEVYTELVYKYNQKPTIEEYCILIGINRDTIYSWLKGEYRNSDICYKLSTTRPDTIKKWQEECRLGRVKGALNGNVGCIFLCKAVDGMVETAPVVVPQGRQVLTAAELPQLGSENGQIAQIPSGDTE